MSGSRLDSQWILALARRGLGRAPEQFADGAVRVVRGMPAEWLESLMRSPARRVVLDSIFWQMPKYLDCTRAAGMNCLIRWRVTGRSDDGVDTYDLEIADGRCRIIREPVAPKSRVTITVDAVEFLRLATGTSNPVHAYFSGRIVITGDILLATRLGSLFRIPPSGARGPHAPSQRAA